LPELSVSLTRISQTPLFLKLIRRLDATQTAGVSVFTEYCRLLSLGKEITLVLVVLFSAEIFRASEEIFCASAWLGVSSTAVLATTPALALNATEESATEIVELREVSAVSDAGELMAEDSDTTTLTVLLELTSGEKVIEPVLGLMNA
jgi:hypothetical protein